MAPKTSERNPVDLTNRCPIIQDEAESDATKWDEEFDRIVASLGISEGESTVSPKMSEHNLYITTSNIPRTYIGDLPDHLSLEYWSKGGTGWILARRKNYTGGDMDGIIVDFVAAEMFKGAYGLRLDVDGIVICDSLSEADILSLTDDF